MSKAMPFQLSPLPYAENALDPVISGRTISFHYGKHHKGYLDKLNELVTGTPLADETLESIIRTTAGDSSRQAIFNNAAQVWNHDFYWRSMRPGGGGRPSGDLASRIDAAFGGFDSFRNLWVDTGMARFGSGYVWLVLDSGTLKVVQTLNAENPMVIGQVPILTSDVWEHAYYLDYQNRRKDHLTALFDSVVNWDFAADNLAKA